MSTIRAVDISGQAREIALWPSIVGWRGEDAGRPIIEHDRHGDGWLVGDMIVRGRNGGFVTALSLTPADLRSLARHAGRLAAFMDARQARKPAPCLCTAWGHGLTDCQNTARDDYSMCDACWPEGGQSTLDMSHGGKNA